MDGSTAISSAGASSSSSAVPPFASSAGSASMVPSGAMSQPSTPPELLTRRSSTPPALVSSSAAATRSTSTSPPASPGTAPAVKRVKLETGVAAEEKAKKKADLAAQMELLQKQMSDLSPTPLKKERTEPDDAFESLKQHGASESKKSPFTMEDSP